MKYLLPFLSWGALFAQQSIPTVTGTGNLGMLSFDGGSSGFGAMVDGANISANCGTNQTQNGGWIISNLNTTCWPNGLHLLVGSASSSQGDPYLLSDTFTSSGISGSTITLANPHHGFVGAVVTFSSTGTLPSPLVPGSQCYWATSATNSCTFTVSESGGVMTFHTSVALGVTAGTPVYVRNIPYTNQDTGLDGCSGYMTAASGSGTTFTVATPPTCPTGTVVSGTAGFPTTVTLSGVLPAHGYAQHGDSVYFSGFTGGWASLNGGHWLQWISGNTYQVNVTTSGSMSGTPSYSAVSSTTPTWGANITSTIELEVNPYFVQSYVSSNALSVSGTPGGPAIALSCAGGCAGTHTMTQRLRSPYWMGLGANNQQNQDLTNFVPTNAYQLVTFANGKAPMILHPKYWEMHLVAGAAATPLCDATTIIQNTDLSFTNTACNASGLTWTEVDDGGVSGVCSVDSSGNVTPLMAGWCQVLVQCAACAAGGTSLASVTVYVQVHTGSVTFPHFTTCGKVATSFTTGSCHSFFPISAWDADPTTALPSLGTEMKEANMNSIMMAEDNDSLNSVTGTSCPTWPTSTMAAKQAWLAQYGMYAEWDLTYTYFTNSSWDTLAAILGNLTYNRQSCLITLINYLVSQGYVWRFYSDDEFTDILGPWLSPNPNIGGANWTSAVTSGGNIVFNLSNVALTLWNQATGSGSPIQVTGLTTNSACNGWYLPSASTSSTVTAPLISGCGNGLTITASSDPGGKINIPPSTNPGLLNRSPLPGCSPAYSCDQQSLSSTVYITTNGSTATLHWPNHGFTTANPPVIRIWGGTTANLNTLAQTSYYDSNTLTFIYPGGTGGAAPNCSNSCNSSTDSNAYITVDPNWGPDAIGQFFGVVRGITNHQPVCWSILGVFFSVASASSLYSYEGNPNHADCSWDYIPQGPSAIYGPDASVYGMLHYSDSSSGLATRAWQLKPRSMLFGGGYIGGGSTLSRSRSFYFNPATDVPAQLSWRPETMVAQLMGMKTLDIVGMRLYNLLQDTIDAYIYLCCGFTGGGWGTGLAMNSYTAPGPWNSMAHTNALLISREDTELQPETNKPYYGPMFRTDAHTSATYGNELTIVCGSEMPYGAFTVSLNAISGGTTLKYVTDGYTTWVTTLAGNPSSDTEEFCTSPGRTTVFVSQPPGYTALDNITFGPPMVNGVVTLPFGASKFLIQVGYYPSRMEDDPVTDCTSTCTIGIDHHNLDSYYRAIYADSNNLPLSIGQPVKIPSQGLY